MSIINNPFISDIRKNIILDMPIEQSDSSILGKHFKNLYIVVKKNDNKIPIDFFMKLVNEKVYSEVTKDLVIWKTSLNFLCRSLYDKLCILPKETLQNINEFNFDLDENNLVLPLFNCNFKNMINYINSTEGINNLDKLYNNLIISQNLLDCIEPNHLRLKETILTLNESNFWCFCENYEIDFNNIFKNKSYYNKKFNKINTSSIYLDNIYRYKRKNSEKDVLIASGFLPIKPSKYTKEDIFNVLDSLTYKNRFLLFCHLLISKECHLVINNYKVLYLMREDLKRFAPLFRYLLGYTFLTLSFDETIKKNTLTNDDPSVFDINTASILPQFPYCKEFSKYNPYSLILVSDTLLNNNLYGLSRFRYNENFNQGDGICNLDEFKRNINIFISGEPNIDIFKNIDFVKYNIAVSGSIMAACLQKYHPLMNMFVGTIDAKKRRYYNEYYPNADIDMMFLTTNVFTFMDNVNNFFNEFIVNIINNNSEGKIENIKLQQKFQLNISVKDSWIKENIVTEKINYEYIYENIQTNLIKDFFKPFIDIELNKMRANEFGTNIEHYKNKYPEYFLNCENYDLNIKIIKNKKEIKEKTINIEDEDNSIENEVIDKSLDIKINFKYKISSPYLNRVFELFMNKQINHISMVNEFHKDCVRGYYDGNNVYLTTHAIKSHMTYINFTSKYVSGLTNEIEIDNKYFSRGWSNYLNDKQFNELQQYVSKNDYWKSLFSSNVKSMKGYLTYKHKIFHPRFINADSFYDCLPVDLEEGYQDDWKGEFYKNTVELDSDIYKMNKIPINIRNQLEIHNFKTVNAKGMIKSVQKWVIEAYYELNN